MPRIGSYSATAMVVLPLAALAATAPPLPSASVADGPSASTAPAAKDPFAVVRGMTISCPGSGQIWGTDAMVQTMAELKELGVNWITIHPYAGIRTDGTVGGTRMSRLYRDTTWLTRPIAEAHRLGLKIMIKPHLAYWGSGFSWRGEIRFQTDEQWQRFFQTYERWITDVATLSADADAFVVGTELGGTMQHEEAWRRIIAAVRKRTDAPLTYSANWDRFEDVPFWDALDAIGIQSYFPLVAHTDLPTAEELDEAWSGLIDRLERFAATHHRHVILAELGYNRSSLAAARPWEARTGGPNAQEIQTRCMTAALRALERSDSVTGAFLWKWFPGERSRRGDFRMSSPAMRQVIAAEWGRGVDR